MEISSLFHNIFNMSLTSEVKLHVRLLNVVVRFIVFLTSATLIFRGTDISKCFRESLGIRDIASRLYFQIYLNQLSDPKGPENKHYTKMKYGSASTNHVTPAKSNSLFFFFFFFFFLCVYFDL